MTWTTSGSGNRIKSQASPSLSWPPVIICLRRATKCSVLAGETSPPWTGLSQGQGLPLHPPLNAYSCGCPCQGLSLAATE